MKILENMTENYIKDLLIRMAHHSTAIEGNTLTQAETASILLNNYIPREMSEREYYEVKNYREAINFLTSNDEEMSTSVIREYHRLIMNNLREDVGEYKKIENIVIGADFEPTKPYQVPYVLQYWCDNYNFRIKKAETLEEKVEAILEHHIRFERIHPFGDGNGRTGRMLIIESCIKENIPPIVIPKEQKARYITYLATENIKEFTKWGLELQELELKRLELLKNQK